VPPKGAAAGGLLLLLVMGVAASSPPLLRAAIALPTVALFVTACLKSPQRSLVGLLLWLAVLGTVRRLLNPSGGASGSDPLLVVAPIVVALLVLIAVRRGAFSNTTRLTKIVLVLCGLIAAAALNPMQGGLSVGAGGLLFVLVPVLWFWVGRAVVDDAFLTRVLRLLSFISLAAAVYGLFQVYRGFPSWDQRWIDTKGYAALRVGESVRPFASFSSSSEYVGLLAIGMVLWACRLRRGNPIFPAAAAMALLSWALVVASVRGALVVVPVTLGVTFATSRGFGIARTAVVAILALFVLGLVVSQIEPAVSGGQASSALVSRQVSGLSDPFNPNTSTLPVHLDALVTGLREGFRQPLGRGLGVITLAGAKFGSGDDGSVGRSTDVDPSNVALAMGLPGLIVYGAVVYFALTLAFRRARYERSYLALTVLGVALVTLFQWLSGGNYAVAPLPWLLLGWLDRRAASATSGRPIQLASAAAI
jgi:hypothetical protein